MEATHAAPAIDNADTCASLANAPATMSNGPDGIGGPICSRNTATNTSHNPCSSNSGASLSIADGAYVTAQRSSMNPQATRETDASNAGGLEIFLGKRENETRRGYMCILLPVHVSDGRLRNTDAAADINRLALGP